MRARVAAYRAANPNKVRESNVAYRAVNRAEINERIAAYYAANPEKGRESDAKYYIANGKKKREYSAAYYAANPEKIRRRVADYRLANPGAIRARNAKRRALKIVQRCACCTNAEIQKVFDIASLCGPGAHVDHITPLALGGHHCVKNLQALTAEDHMKKTTFDFAAMADVRRRSQLLHSWSRFGVAGELTRQTGNV
jgi:5-methylcytosine-specific restriction endonuclease McrA